jgi:GT2 family glycosyltransferase
MGAGPPILAVLVLYQVEASNCLTLVSFFRALDESGLVSQFRLLIYDNSPCRSIGPLASPVPFSCIHDPANGGLFGAYNSALQMAEKEGNDWLLLLDQDTEINADYLKKLWRGLGDWAGEQRCAALVPKLLAKNAIISPTRVLWGWRLLPVDKTFTGMAPWEIAVLNSGTLLRISAVREVGGFNQAFWLDYLDHWLFNRLYSAGYQVFVLDAELSHELSLTDMRSMQVGRYNNILSAEGQFYKTCKSSSENWFYLIKLLIRAAKMLAVPGQRRLLLPTLTHLVRHVMSKFFRFVGTRRPLK